MGEGFAFRPLHAKVERYGTGTELKSRPGTFFPQSVLSGGNLQLLESPKLLRIANKAHKRMANGLPPMDGKSAEGRLKSVFERLLPWNGNGNKGKETPCPLEKQLFPPVSLEAALGLMERYYQAWLAKEHPENKEEADKLRLRTGSYVNSVIQMNCKAVSQKEKEFIAKVKLKAYEYSRDMIGSRKGYDAALSDYKTEMQDSLERINNDEQLSRSSIAEFYLRKSAMMDEWSGKFSKISKAGLGGSVVAWIAQAVQNMFEQVPVLRDLASWILPAVASGMIVISAAFKFVLPWHLQTVKNRLPVRKAQRLEDMAERMEGRRREQREVFEERRKYLEEDLSKNLKAAEGAMRQAYSDLLVSYGYVPVN